MPIVILMVSLYLLWFERWIWRPLLRIVQTSSKMKMSRECKTNFGNCSDANCKEVLMPAQEVIQPHNITISIFHHHQNSGMQSDSMSTDFLHQLFSVKMWYISILLAFIQCLYKRRIGKYKDQEQHMTEKKFIVPAKFACLNF